MKIDTSSYYPEVDDPEGGQREDSLNGRFDSLFGDPMIKETVSIEETDQNRMLETGPASSGKKEPEIWDHTLTLISHIISWLFVPMLMPVYGILFIFKLTYLDVLPEGVQTAVTFVIAGINFFAPMLIIFLMKNLGLVKDVGLNTRKERTIPYVLFALCYAASAWFVISRGAPTWVAMFFWGGCAISFVYLFINLFWKISAHAAGVAALVALLIRLHREMGLEPQTFVWILITVGVAGIVGSARVWLEHHTVWQVLAGYTVGFCCVFFLMAVQ